MAHENKSYVQARDAWKAKAGLMTFDEAVRICANTASGSEAEGQKLYSRYASEGATAYGASLSYKRRIAPTLLPSQRWLATTCPRSSRPGSNKACFYDQ